MKDLKIAFMGTPDFAVASLDALLESGLAVVAVVTAPDRPAGRGRKPRASAVCKRALEHGLRVLQPTNLKDPAFLETLKACEVNLIVVVAFRMLPEAVWSFPEYGTFNLHASLLPDYRGAAPINWALINGETETGVTTFFIEHQIDTGNIILQESVKIGAEETAGELHDRLMALGAELVVKTTKAIASGAVTTRKQKHLESPKKAPKLNREARRISWDSSSTEIFDLVRGLSPYPAAWTTFYNDGDTTEVKIFKTRKTNRKTDLEAGAIISENRGLWVQTADDLLEVLELQLEGRRRMSVSDVLNGLELEKNARFR